MVKWLARAFVSFLEATKQMKQGLVLEEWQLIQHHLAESPWLSRSQAGAFTSTSTGK